MLTRPYPPVSHQTQIAGPFLSVGISENIQPNSVQCTLQQQFDVEHASHSGFERQCTYAPPPEPVHQHSHQWILGSLLTDTAHGNWGDTVMPPGYTQPLLPEYDFHGQQSELYADGVTGYLDSGNLTEAMWDPHYSGCIDWNTELEIGSGLSLPVAEPLLPPPPLITTPEDSLYAPRQPREGSFRVQPSYVLSPEDGSTEGSSENDSKEDSSDSDAYESDGSEQDSPAQTRKNAENPRFVVNKWSISSMIPYSGQDSRSFICPLTGHLDVRGKRCNARFVRPEHCRRHVKTVHGEARDHRCKVPGCHRSFSRGDNLRDHYWTHLHRGGRTGRNDKMTLAELKSILGKSEKTLVRRLKAKMARSKSGEAKRTCTEHAVVN